MGLTLTSFYKVIRQPKVLSIINASALHSAYLKAVKDYIQPLMVSVALTLPFLLEAEVEKKNGLIIGIIYFLIYLATSRASQLASKAANNRKQAISYSTLLLGFLFGIGCGVFYYYDLWVSALLSFIGIYMIENIRKPILTGFVADNVPNEILVSVISTQSLIKTIITAILALAFGILADKYGIGMSFIIVSTFLILTTILINSMSINKRLKE